MSRLASLSTPNRRLGTPSPSASPSASTSLPVSRTGTPTPTRPTETTHHRMLRMVLQSIMSLLKQWDELVGLDGLKAGKGVIDESTEMDNLLLCVPEERPSILPHYGKLIASRAALQSVITKLGKLLNKLILLVDSAEKIYFEAVRVQWIGIEEPMWISWTLERFVDSLPTLINLHINHLDTLTTLSKIILDPNTSFEIAKSTLERWRDLSIGGLRYDGIQDWQELVSLEMGEGIFDEKDGEEEEGDVVKLSQGVGNGKRKGKR